MDGELQPLVRSDQTVMDALLIVILGV